MPAATTQLHLEVEGGEVEHLTLSFSFKHMCYVLRGGLPVVSPALWTPHLPRGEVSNFGALTPALPVSLQRVRLVSEPCTLSINGVTFGLTSTDLLFHMGAEEISR